MAIAKGGTPTHTFTCSVDLSDAVALYITYAQNGRPVLEKDIGDCTINGTTVTCQLSQADTLVFDSAKKVKIQIRARTADNAAFVSQVVETTAAELLKPGVI